MPKKTKASKAKKSIEFAPIIVTEKSDSLERVYSNRVEFKISPIDVTLVFSEIDTEQEAPPSRASAVEIKAKPKVRIVLPRSVFFSLAEIMGKFYDENLRKSKAN